MGRPPPRRGVISSGNLWQENDLTENNDAEKTKNKTAKMTMDEAFATIESQVSEIKQQKELIGDLTKQLEEANKVLEGQEKGRLIGDIMPKSNFKVADLAGKSVDDLKNIRATLDQAMPPRVNSVRFGVRGADLSDREKGLTVGDLSIVTAARRKGAA
jgi:hypothetical protein